MNVLKRSKRGVPKDRSAKRRALSNTALTAHASRYQEALRLRWQALSSKDQLALSLLMLFLLVIIGGYGGYSLHMAAKDSKENYQEHVADYFWLRAQAGNIDSSVSADMAKNGDASLSPASQINTVLNTAGISDAQVIASGESVQIAFSHDSQASVGRALANLEQQGWTLTTLSMQQDPITKRIEVQAAVI